MANVTSVVVSGQCDVSGRCDVSGWDEVVMGLRWGWNEVAMN